ncbi:hypothetical protein [Ruminococcus flavefaciens]|uniref:hypothetical protein n=1 Tax=Ruminococcus flavefaciens TaxID=1265 RepID=UPI000490B4E5|nr:hypothetical protein [Ruminococcus flavefaciens]
MSTGINSTEDAKIQAIDENVLESDGVIEPMNTNTLVKKLSMLRKGTTLDEMTEIFGKEPFIVKETNENIFKYYIGDITVTLWGTELFQATVECMDSVFSIDLGIAKKIAD